MMRTRGFLAGAAAFAGPLVHSSAIAQSAPASSRPRIEAVLSDFSRAALAGDASAVLSLIDASDAHFGVEMRHWAEDLAKHRPFEFEAKIVEEGEFFEESRALCGVVFTWRIALDENGREIAPEKAWARHATFPPIEFTRGEDGRWRWAGERWQVIEGDGFVVKYLPGDEAVAREVLVAFPISRRHVDEGFGIAGTTPQTIKLYADMDHLKATVYLSMPDPYLGGWNEPGESIKFMRNYAKEHRHWVRAFAHEYGHVATWELGPAATRLPWWMQEGVAELAAEEFDPGKGEFNEREMRRYALGRGVAPWDKLADYDTCEQPLKHQAYVQGHHFMGYVSDRFGRDKRNEWLRRLSDGAGLDESARNVLGVGFDDLSDSWRATLPARAEPGPAEPAGAPST